MARPANKQTAVEVVGRLREAGFEALLAGGCVRDMLLGEPSSDYDVATSATPDQIAGIFPKVLMIGAKFGVAMVILKGRMIEVTTFRSDQDYADGRRPSSVSFTDARHDAQRRDFTINGMFYDPQKDEVIDYVGGREDLKKRIIRTIGSPEVRFNEDYLRMIRAVRFAVRLGFDVDADTAQAIRHNAHNITCISPERILEELRKMLQRANADGALRLMEELGLARHVLGELFERDLWERALRRVAAVAARQDLPLTFGALLCELDPADIKRIVRRWGGSNEMRDSLVYLSKHLGEWRKAREMSLAQFKKLLGDPDFPRLRRLWTYQEKVSDGSSKASREIARRARSIDPSMVSPDPLVSGEDLKTMGVEQGPRMGSILRRVYEAQLNEQLVDRSAALRYARDLIDDRREEHGGDEPSARTL